MKADDHNRASGLEPEVLALYITEFLFNSFHANSWHSVAMPESSGAGREN